MALFSSWETAPFQLTAGESTGTNCSRVSKGVEDSRGPPKKVPRSERARIYRERLFIPDNEPIPGQFGEGTIDGKRRARSSSSCNAARGAQYRRAVLQC